MPWTRPVSRMKEFVAALRAIFACWNDDEPLRFDGEFYSHTLMPPLLQPSPVFADYDECLLPPSGGSRTPDVAFRSLRSRQILLSRPPAWQLG